MPRDWFRIADDDERGVVQILKGEYKISYVGEATCPVNQLAAPGVSFICIVEVGGVDKPVKITAKSSDGEYEVGQPRRSGVLGARVDASLTAALVDHGPVTANEDQQSLSRRRATREMLAANDYASALTNTFIGTRYEAEARELARLVADSAVDAAVLRRGAHRSSSAEEKAAAAQQVARRERQRAEEAVERWFTEEDIRD